MRQVHSLAKQSLGIIITLAILFISLFGLLTVLRVHDAIGTALYIILLIVLFVCFGAIFAIYFYMTNKKKKEEEKGKAAPIINTTDAIHAIESFMRKYPYLVLFKEVPRIARDLPIGVEGSSTKPMFHYRNRDSSNGDWWDVFIRKDDAGAISPFKNASIKEISSFIASLSEKAPMDTHVIQTQKTDMATGTPIIETRYPTQHRSPSLEDLKKMTETKKVNVT